MPIVAHVHPFVVGVDTHARTHALAILTPVGEVFDAGQFDNTAAGRARAIAWVGRRTGGDLDTLWAIEGAGSYGARLSAEVAQVGYRVVEAPRMSTRSRHGIGKSDLLDARQIAQALLAAPVDRLRHPRQGDGIPAALRVLVTARDQMSTERTVTINALTALLRIVDLGVDARRPLTLTQIRRIVRWHPRTEHLAAATARTEAVRLAKRIMALTADLKANRAALTELLRHSPAAVLLEQPGIGPVSAALALAAWSHQGRLRDEAAFASLAGVNPIPASSGNTVRHRLNRGGDRRLNQALHMVIVTRMRTDPHTRDYVHKRTTEGRSKKEIIRCLKRYLARQIYRTLTTAARTSLETRAAA